MMIVHKERRDRHLQKLDREQHHEELEECKVSDKARERSKLCTQLHRSRLNRRKYKDIFEETDDIVQFFNVGQHKKVLDQMGQLIGKVRKVEKYHENRVYIPRLQEGEDTDG